MSRTTQTKPGKNEIIMDSTVFNSATFVPRWLPTATGKLRDAVCKALHQRRDIKALPSSSQLVDATNPCFYHQYSGLNYGWNSKYPDAKLFYHLSGFALKNQKNSSVFLPQRKCIFKFRRSTAFLLLAVKSSFSSLLLFGECTVTNTCWEKSHFFFSPNSLNFKKLQKPQKPNHSSSDGNRPFAKISKLKNEEGSRHPKHLVLREFPYFCFGHFKYANGFYSKERKNMKWKVISNWKKNPKLFHIEKYKNEAHLLGGKAFFWKEQHCWINGDSHNVSGPSNLHFWPVLHHTSLETALKTSRRSVLGIDLKWTLSPPAAHLRRKRLMCQGAPPGEKWVPNSTPVPIRG